MQQVLAGTQGATVPGAPQNPSASVTGATTVSVTFSAPASNGGSPITGYTVYGGGTDSNAGSTSLTHNITGLTQGSPYTFTVKATNAVGEGPASSASNSVTPATVPDAPTIGTATPGNGQISITFTPGYDGGSAVSTYTATASPGGAQASGGGSPITITGLTNGQAYTVTVTATNAYGTSSASGTSNSATPSTVPDAPTIGTATAGNGQASITFTPPGNNGGSAITGYTMTSSPGGFTGTGGSSPIVVTGLNNGTSYTFTCTATNANGTGAASGSSNSVTPFAQVSASYSVSSCAGAAVSPANATTNSVTCNTSNGVGPFTYSWAWVTGGTDITINSSTSATTTFTVTNNTIGNYSGTCRCTVVDTGDGNYSTYYTGYDVDVSIDIEV
jgi:hypothetical protein